MDDIFDLIYARVPQARLARLLGIEAPALVAWRHRNRIPAERVLDVARATNLSPHLLRPDLYPDPSWVPPKDAA